VPVLCDYLHRTEGQHGQQPGGKEPARNRKFETVHRELQKRDRAQADFDTS
jgi:hypothetical protein